MVKFYIALIEKKTLIDQVRFITTVQFRLFLPASDRPRSTYIMIYINKTQGFFFMKI